MSEPGRATEPVVIGLDGGGTSFRVVVLDSGGVELARAEAPAVRVLAGLPGPVVTAVGELVTRACARAGVQLPVSSFWAGIAGAGREAVRAELEGALGRAGLARHTRVGTDVEAAFHDAFGDGAGILLMSGTGSIAYGRSDDGREARVGGWGSLLGDEGSGYAIGIEAMRRIARSVDGRGQNTDLGRRVLGRLELGDAQELITWASTASRASIAALVPEVQDAAASGDLVAGEILVRAIEELEGHVLTLLNVLGPWQGSPRIALGGGLLDPTGPLRRPLERVLRAHHAVAFLERELDPAMGAARLARAGGVAARA